jgi:DNA-binding NarL/FixJ family response regulator
MTVALIGNGTGFARFARGATTTATIAVSVLANDRIAAAGVSWHLSSAPGIRLVADDQAPDADVVVVCAVALDEGLLGRMAAAADQARNPRQVMVLVSDVPGRRALAKAKLCGVVSFVARTDAGGEVIATAVIASAACSGHRPDGRPAWVLDHNGRLAEAAMGPGRPPLTEREIGVLRLLADGLSTIEIAQRLSYSDRTVKKIIHELLAGLNLRNRAHAVAYAGQVGVI